MKKARKLNYIHFVITYNFVLLIPMIIVFCSVFIMEGRQQVQKIEKMCIRDSPGAVHDEQP